MKKYTKQGIVLASVMLIVVIGYSLPRYNKHEKSTSTKGHGMEHLSMDSFKEKICDCGINESGNSTEWKYKGDLPAVIDFYADWCGPCKMVSPILEELSKEYEGRLNIYKINTEQQQQLAGMFGIRSIPSILFIPVDGQPTMAAGALPKKEFVKIFREVLGVEEVVSAL